MPAPIITVIICTHNPNACRLRRTLVGLSAQTLATETWELVLVDNASNPAITPDAISGTVLPNLRLTREPRLGLSHARRHGMLTARGELIVMVDDDNVLEATYLDAVLAHFETHPRVGALGGACRPEFERQPDDWQRPFLDLLALRDLGKEPLIGELQPSGNDRPGYPECAPIGAGMALRRTAAQTWIADSDPAASTDRRGSELTSAGDNDIVIHILRAGWSVAYFPDLSLTHLIPAGRLDPGYLARLNRGIQKSWMQVLLRHDLSDWPRIPRWTVPLRQIKAWFTHRAWSSAAARVRWQGACGHFEGRAS